MTTRPVTDLILATKSPEVTVVADSNLVAQVTSMVQRLGDAPAITDQTSFDVVRAIVRDAKKTHNTIEAARVLAKAPFKGVCDKIDAMARTLFDQLNAVMTEGKSQEADFLIERDRQIAKEAEDRRIAEAAAMVDNDRPTAPIIAPVLHAPVVAPLQSRKVVTVVSPELLPREYLVPDMVRINTDALAGKIIPGVSVTSVSTISAR